MMMGAYRLDQYANPDHFAMTCVRVLEDFPDVVIENATSPKSGLQTQAAFPPNPAEIRAFCERSLRSYSAIALNNARKARAAEAAKAQSKPAAAGPKVDLFAVHPYLKAEAKQARLIDPRSSHRPWVPRSLKELAAEAGRTLTDEDIEKMPNNPVEQWDRWKKLKVS